MRFIKQELSPHDWNIALINDWHLGSHAVNEDLLNKVLKFIDANRENTRILINGDLFHNITKHSKGSPKDQKLTPQEQFDYAEELLYPYRDLIDGVTVGNHDIRTEDNTDIDLMYMFCKTLNIKDKYLRHRGVIGYSINKNFYSIEMFHGTSGGSTVASVERNMKKMKRSTADVFYTGHWHKEYSKPMKEYHIDPYNKRVTEYKKWHVCGNTLVNTEEYAERFSYDESYPSQAILKLSGVRGKRNIEVEWLR